MPPRMPLFGRGHGLSGADQVHRFHRGIEQPGIPALPIQMKPDQRELTVSGQTRVIRNSAPAIVKHTRQPARQL